MFRSQLAQDYNPSELALIAKGFAKGKLKLSFQDGLEEKLAAHIAFKHKGDISDRNAGLAINLTEAAFRGLARRAVKQNLRGEDCTTLVPEDFEIVEGAAAAAAAAAAAEGGDADGESKGDGAGGRKGRRGEDDEDTLGRSMERMFSQMVERVIPPLIEQHMTTISRNAFNGAGDRAPPPPGMPGGPPGPGGAEGAGAGAEQGRVQVATQEAEKEEEEEEEEEQEEEDEQEEEEEEVQVKVKGLELLAIKALGQSACPASYEWRLGDDAFFIPNPIDGPKSCTFCSRAWTLAGYRCSGLTHFVCIACVNERVKKLKKDARKEAQKKSDRENFETC